MASVSKSLRMYMVSIWYRVVLSGCRQPDWVVLHSANGHSCGMLIILWRVSTQFSRLIFAELVTGL